MKQIFVLLGLLFLLSCHSKNKDYIATISTLPSFDLLLIDSTTLFHAQQIQKGRPIVVLYFRPDCPHCKEETMAFIANMDKLKNIQFFYLSGASIEDLRAFSQHYHLDHYQNVTIGKDYQHSFTKIFHPSSVPYLAIYDSQKKLVKIYDGEIPISSIISAAHS